MRRTTPGVLLLSLLLAAIPAVPLLAQQPDGPGSTSTQSRKEYRIRPGDRLSIALADHPEESQDQVLVSTDGTISFYTVNNFRIAGLSRREAEKQIEDQLDLRNARVSINLVQAPGMMITVSGAVQKPTAVEYNEGITLLDAIARAGSIRNDADKVALVTTTDDTGARVARTVDLIAAETGRPGANPELQPGDLVFINDATVSVGGEVRKPGTYALRTADTVFRAIAAAEGVSLQADPRQILLKREGKAYLVNLERIDTAPPDLAAAEVTAATPTPAQALPGDLELKRGDMLFVPVASLTVNGEVAVPGQFPLAGIDTGLKALATAKGPKLEADLAHAFILRDDGRQRIPIDLTAVGPDASLVYDGTNPVGANFPLKRGDVLVVPPMKTRVQVFGAVAKAGDYTFVPGAKDHLLDALSEASVSPGADLSRVRLQRVWRGEPEVLVLDVSVQGSPANNVILRDGDQVQVPERKVNTWSPLLYSVGSALLGAFLLRP